MKKERKRVCLVVSKGYDRLEVLERIEELKGKEGIKVVTGQQLGEDEFIRDECLKRDIPVRVCSFRYNMYNDYSLAAKVRNKNIITRSDEYIVMYKKGDYIVGNFIKSLKYFKKEYKFYGA